MVSSSNNTNKPPACPKYGAAERHWADSGVTLPTTFRRQLPERSTFALRLLLPPTRLGTAEKYEPHADDQCGAATVSHRSRKECQKCHESFGHDDDDKEISVWLVVGGPGWRTRLAAG